MPQYLNPCMCIENKKYLAGCQKTPRSINFHSTQSIDFLPIFPKNLDTLMRLPYLCCGE